MRIKAALFPYETHDMDRLLGELDEADFIHRYRVENDPLIAIHSFIEHQRPHPKEPQSRLKPPPSREKKRQAVERFSFIPSSPVGREGKGMDTGILDTGVLQGLPPPKEMPENKFESGESFWTWFQFQRREANCITEKPPTPRSLSTWWNEVHLELGGNVEALEEAAELYAEDPYWEARKPSMPFAGFMSQWRKYVVQEEKELEG